LKVSTSGIGIDILLFGLEEKCSGGEHNMSATARLKKLFNFVKREAVFLQFVQAGHNDHELVLFL
jgi:hypothetical protein